jgi:DNA-binding transcriptional LysR family regulator
VDWDEHRLSRRLKLRDLNVLLTVARCGSMGKAAEQLAVSQPAISKAVADMEHSLGVRLLDRTAHGVEPTIYARALLDRGLVAFDELKQAVKHIAFLANPTTGELRIGSNIIIASGFVTAVIDRLSRRYPRIVFHVMAGESGVAYRTLEERKIDLAVVPMVAPLMEEHLHAETLYEETLIVLAGARSAWARRRRIALADLMDTTWTLPPPDSLYGGIVAEAFRAAGLDLPRATVFTSVTPVRNALLRTGRFVSMVQGSAVRFGARMPSLRVLPIDLPTTRRPVGVVTLKNRTLSPVARLFIDCAHDVARALPKRQRR